MGIVVTNSTLKAFQRCRRQYHYKMVQRRIPKQIAIPLKRGTWMHELLEAHYNGYGWRKRHKELTKEFNKMFEEEREFYGGDLPEICKRIMRSYCYRWKEEDAGMTWLAVEQEFEAPLPHGHTLKFKVDGIVEDEWGQWLAEHKNHKTLPDDNYRFIDIQTARYVWGLNKHHGYNIVGVMWNYLRMKPPGIPKLTLAGNLSKAKIETDVLTFTEALIDYGLDPRDFRDDIMRLKKHNPFFKRSRVPKPDKVIETLVKEAVYTADEIERGFKPIRTIDRSCTFSCSYLQPCMASLYGGDELEILESQYDIATEKDYYAYTQEKEQ